MVPFTHAAFFVANSRQKLHDKKGSRAKKLHDKKNCTMCVKALTVTGTVLCIYWSCMKVMCFEVSVTVHLSLLIA